MPDSSGQMRQASDADPNGADVVAEQSSAIRPEILGMIAAALKLEESLSPDQREYILRVCRNPVPLASSPPLPTEPCLTPEETARRLHVSLRTIHRMIKTGELPSTVIRRCRRIPQTALAEIESTASGQTPIFRARHSA